MQMGMPSICESMVPFIQRNSLFLASALALYGVRSLGNAYFAEVLGDAVQRLVLLCYALLANGEDLHWGGETL